MNNPTDLSDEQCIALFLNWYNDFITVKRFAEYQGFSVDYADKVIAYGKYCHKMNTETDK